ncbi:MAG: hypothetical protein ACPG4Y_06695 [Chitinophagales bacterium]
MKRRKFIKTLGLTSAASFMMPSILKSGTFGTSASNGFADHVVFVGFAGGLRQQETMMQRYLTDSQGLNGSSYEGNIMYNMLNGSSPTDKIVYGTDPAFGLPGSNPIPQILAQTLETQGTTFKEIQAAGYGHYSALVTLLSGSKSTTQGLRRRPAMPTIFEYARKHLDLAATDTWFIGNGLGNSTPLLNYSNHPDYGAKYGANFLAPSVAFGNEGEKHIKNGKVYGYQQEMSKIYEMQQFLNKSYNLSARDFGGVENTPEEKEDIKAFFREMFNKKASNLIARPPVSDNNDMNTIGYACEVLKWFKPKLTFINLNNIDTCHANFTGYLKNIHRADHAIGHLWNYIQTQIPEMAGNTFMMLTPDIGRNLEPNNVVDENDWLSYDHSDANATRIFSQMVGAGVQANLQVGGPGNQIGDITDSMLTVGEALGIKNMIQSEGLISGDAVSLFDRI